MLKNKKFYQKEILCLQFLHNSSSMHCYSTVEKAHTTNYAHLVFHKCTSHSHTKESRNRSQKEEEKKKDKKGNVLHFFAWSFVDMGLVWGVVGGVTATLFRNAQ